MRKFLIIFLLISAVGIPYASAHPFTLETNPSASLNAPVGITEVYVIFSEPVELDFSSLKIYDSNGDQIDNKDTRIFQYVEKAEEAWQIIRDFYGEIEQL